MRVQDKLTRPARGVVLTEQGLWLLEEALARWWEQETPEHKTRHRKLAQEAIAERLGFNIKTVRRLRIRQAVDRETLRAAFEAMDLAWNDAYCIHAALWYRIQGEGRAASGALVPHPSFVEGDTLPSEAGASWPSFPIIRRDHEIKETVSVLGVSRLVTLTGIGGVGKSRLARDVTAEWATEYHPVRTHWVDLSTGTLEGSDETAWILKGDWGTSGHAALARYLSDCSLLVLDNYEQAKLPAGLFLRTLLSACPGLRVLVTSCGTVGVPGEAVRAVLPFPVPAPQEVRTRTSRLAYVAGFPSVQLFVQVLRTLQPLFQLTEENAEQVAALCYNLDGVPRTLELAAVAMAGYPYRRDAIRSREESQEAPLSPTS